MVLLVGCLSFLVWRVIRINVVTGLEMLGMTVFGREENLTRPDYHGIYHMGEIDPLAMSSGVVLVLWVVSV